jgi:hypothetical protein
VSLDTEGLIGMQVAQLEKEKKELSERLRIVAKRVDRIERAYRKDARLLLAQDYEQQQTTDRETFAAIQTQCKEGARLAHEEHLETKKRLARMLPDYEKRRVVFLAKKGEKYAKRKDAASRKIEEKAKRRKAVMAKREEASPKNPRTSLSSPTRCLVSVRLRRRRRWRAVVGAGRPPRRRLSRLRVRRWRAASRRARRAPARCCVQIRSSCAAWRCPRRQQLARQARSGWWCTCTRSCCLSYTRSPRREGGASKRRRRLPDGAGREGRVAALERTGVKLRFPLVLLIYHMSLVP